MSDNEKLFAVHVLSGVHMFCFTSRKEPVLIDGVWHIDNSEAPDKITKVVGGAILWTDHNDALMAIEEARNGRRG